jgi:cytochrome c peroxidase
VDKRSNPEVAQAWQAMSEPDQLVASQIYANIGKAIAAYERLLQPAPSRFDTYAKAIRDNLNEGLDVLSKDEVEGLRLFVGDARCIECHNGPLFSNDSFANIGTPGKKNKPFDFGRSIGVNKVINAEFNCTSQYSDANATECFELRFIKRVGDDLSGSFKVPGLRNVTKTAPYMHAGQMKDLDEVMEHYNKAPTPLFGHTMLTKLKLKPHQLDQLKQFMHTLDSDLVTDKNWLIPPITNKSMVNKPGQ